MNDLNDQQLFYVASIFVMSMLIIFTILWFALNEPAERDTLGRDESLDFNRRNGKWRVRYPDGYYSQPFCYDVAQDYAEMFNGTVVPTKTVDTPAKIR